jgi:hypothetical protein
MILHLGDIARHFHNNFAPYMVSPATKHNHPCQPTTHGALLKRLCPISFWRSEQNLLKGLAALYRASEQAREIPTTGNPDTQ